MLNLIKLENRIVLDGAAGGEALDHVLAHEAVIAGSMFVPDHVDGAAHVAGAAALLADPVAEEAQTESIEIVLIADSLPDSETLANAVKPGVQVIIYHMDESAAEVLAQVAASGQPVDSISILSHGGEGSFRLGNEEITAENLEETADAWKALNDILTDDGRIYLFGCNVASGEGQELLDRLAEITGAQVFASDDGTGADGDWDLEKGTGDAKDAPPLDMEKLAGYTSSLQDNTVTTNEDTDYTFKTDDFGDGFSTLQVVKPLSAGELQLNRVNVAIDQAIPADQIAAGNLTFIPNQDANGDGYANFHFKIDGNGPYTMTVDVTPVEDAPTATDNVVETDEDVGYVFLENDFIFNDVDGDNPPLESRTFTSVTVAQAPASGNLELNGTEIGTGAVIQIADIQNGKLMFMPDPNGNGIPYATFRFRVSDGMMESAGAYQMTVNVTPVNDLPTSASKEVRMAEDGLPHVFRLNDFRFADVDAGDQLANVQIVQPVTAGTLKLNGGEVDSTTEITRTQIQNGDLTFTPDKDANGDDYANFRFKVGDDHDAYSKDPYTMTIHVDPTPDPPKSEGGTVTTQENTEHVFQKDDFKFEDVDAGDELASLRITDLPNAGTLKLNGSGVVAGTLVPVADIDAGRLTFEPDLNTHGDAYANFRFKVTDTTGQESVDSARMVVDVAEVNDPPIAADNTVRTDEDTPYAFTAENFGFQDPDNDPFAKVEITKTVSAGSLRLNGVDVSLGEEILVAAINEGRLIFTPAKDANGEEYADFRFKVNDGIFYSLDAYTMTIDVTEVNDAPTAEGKTVTTKDDEPYAFRVEDFRFSDVDADDRLSQVQITEMDEPGTLALNGTKVTSGQYVSVDEIVAGNLTFTPDDGESGAGYSGFLFKVVDSKDLASEQAYQMSIDVTKDNIPPTAGDNTITTNEDTEYIFTPANFKFYDEDTGDTLQAVRIVKPATAGVLMFDGEPLDIEETGSISVSDIAARKLSFKPNDDANGDGYANFLFKVSDNNAAFSANAYTMTVNVTPVQDAPTSVDNTVKVSEGAVYPFKVEEFIFNDVDPEDSLAKVEVTSLPGKGTLRLHGAEVAQGDVIGVAAIINGQFTFTPKPETPGETYATTFQFRVNDSKDFSVNIKNGELSDDPYTMTVDVEPGDLPPKGPANPPAVDEDTDYTFGISDFNFENVGLDFEDQVGYILITKTVTAGTLKLDGTEVQLFDEIAVSDIKAGRLTFRANPEANEFDVDADFRFRIQETGAEGTEYSEDVYVMPITVTPVNDPPVTYSGDEIKLEMNQDSYDFKASDFPFENYVDGEDLNVYQLADGTFASTPGSGQLIQSSVPITVWITSLPEHGTLQLDGQPVEINQAITYEEIKANRLTFEKPADSSSLPLDADGYANVSFLYRVGDELGEYTGDNPAGRAKDDPVNWNTGVSNEETKPVSWLVNRPPEIKDQEFTIPEGSPAGTPVGDTTASDPDGDVLTYSVLPGKDSSIFNVNPNTGQIFVRPGAVVPNVDADTDYHIDVQVDDGRGGLAQAEMTIKVLDVRPVIDLDEPPEPGGDGELPPGATEWDFGRTFTEGDDPVTIADVDARITDPKGDNIDSMTVTITNLQAGDLLSADTSGTNITATYNNGILTLTGTDTAGNYTNVLRDIRFHNPSENPDATQRVIQFVATDDTGIASNIATCYLTVVPVNDAPVNTVPGDQVTPENTPLPFNNGNQISVVDVDSYIYGDPVTVDPAYTADVTLSVDIGTISLTGGPGAPTIQIQGTLATINTQLANLVFTPPTGWTGETILRITTNDLGYTGEHPETGGVDSNGRSDPPLTVANQVRIYVGNPPPHVPPPVPPPGPPEGEDGVVGPYMGEGRGFGLGFDYDPGPVLDVGQRHDVKPLPPGALGRGGDDLYRCCTLEEALRLGCRFAPGIEPDSRLSNVTWKWMEGEGWEAPLLDEESDLYSSNPDQRHFLREEGDVGFSVKPGEFSWLFFGEMKEEGLPAYLLRDNFVQGAEDKFCNAAPGEFKYSFFAGREEYEAPASWGSDAWPLLGNVIPCEEDAPRYREAPYEETPPLDTHAVSEPAEDMETVSPDELNEVLENGEIEEAPLSRQGSSRDDNGGRYEEAIEVSSAKNAPPEADEGSLSPLDRVILSLGAARK